MRFKGKAAVITAVASGIGRATANIIGREGGRIAAVDIDRERLDATVAEIAAAGGGVIGWEHVLRLPPGPVALDDAGDGDVADLQRAHDQIANR